MTDSQGNEIGKLFVGGLSQSTTNESLRNYFSQHFGEVEDAIVMMDNRTGRSRGFGYVKYKDSESVTAVLDSKPHVLDGKEIDAKQCNINMKGKNRRSLKIFVGGIALDQEGETLRAFFEQYGHVTDVNLMMDPTKQRHRGFAFVGFEDEAVVKHLISLHYVTINGKQVELKAMEPPNFDRKLPQQTGTQSQLMQQSMMCPRGTGDRPLMAPNQPQLFRQSVPYAQPMGYSGQVTQSWGVHPAAWSPWTQPQNTCEHPQWSPWSSYPNTWYQSSPNMWPPQQTAWPGQQTAVPQPTPQPAPPLQCQWGGSAGGGQWDPTAPGGVQTQAPPAPPGATLSGSHTTGGWTSHPDGQPVYDEAGMSNAAVTPPGTSSSSADYCTWMCNSKDYKVMTINVDGEQQCPPGGSGDYSRSANPPYSYHQIRR